MKLERLDELDPAGASDVASELLREGVQFRGITDEVPWLVAARPFAVSPELRARLERIGGAVFAYFDALQALYRDGNEVVRRELDGLTPPWLCGIEVERTLEMFRLDVLISDGRPWITEVEETFGNAGKMLAMERAYGLPPSTLLDFLAARGIERILVCDDFPEYVPELAIVARHLSERTGGNVRAELFSGLRGAPRGAAWRFATVAELQRYGRPWVERLVRAAADFVNPLFHGYGTKAALALVHDERVSADLARLAPAALRTLRASVPRSVTLPSLNGSWPMPAAGRRRLVLKVMECPTAPELSWGSRGVIFGERSSRQWDTHLGEAVAGWARAPDGRRHRARLALCELVESDRFDVDFLHPDRTAICRMPRARCRLGPIFVRGPEGVRLTGGHATFVNTSRKVHLGRHAACAPLDLAGEEGTCTRST